MKSKNHKHIDFINSETIAKKIIEKLISNTIIESSKKKYFPLITQLCLSVMKKNINILINELNISHEIDNSCTVTEYNVTQPMSSKIERTAVYKVPIEKNSPKISAKNNFKEEVYKKVSDIKPIKFSKTKKLYANKENIEIDKKKIDIETLYPFYDIKEKIEKNFTPAYNDEIKEIMMKKFKIEEDKKENKQTAIANNIKIKNNIIQKANKIEKYKRKNISVDSDGKVILLKKIDMNNNTSSEFIKINSMIINHKKRKSKSSVMNDQNTQNEIVIKNKKRSDLYFNTTMKTGKIIVGAGSSFQNFFPEVGVCMKEEGKIKDGGKNFYLKYNKYTSSQFYDIFSNIGTQKTQKKIGNNFNPNSNNISSNINNNINKALTKTISLPEINANNNTSNYLEKNNFSINSFAPNASLLKSEIKNKTMYFSRNSNDRKIKYMNSNYIKINDNFRKVLFIEQNNDSEKSNNNINADLNKSKNNKNRSLLNNINEFNISIISNHNWGEMTSVVKKGKNNSYINILDYKNKIKDIHNSTTSNFRIRNKNKLMKKTHNIFENSYQ